MPLTACKQYCLAAGATQGNIAYTQTVVSHYTKFQTELETYWYHQIALIYPKGFVNQFDF